MIANGYTYYTMDTNGEERSIGVGWSKANAFEIEIKTKGGMIIKDTKSPDPHGPFHFRIFMEWMCEPFARYIASLIEDIPNGDLCFEDIGNVGYEDFGLDMIDTEAAVIRDVQWGF